MELIVAVLVYLGVFVEGNTYSPAQIEEKANQVQPQVQEVLANDESTQSALQAFENSNWQYSPETGLVEPWEEEDEEVIIYSR